VEVHRRRNYAALEDGFPSKKLKHPDLPFLRVRLSRPIEALPVPSNQANKRSWKDSKIVRKEGSSSSNKGCTLQAVWFYPGTCHVYTSILWQL